MIDAVGQQFPELMRSAVFTNIRMTDTTYEQPLPLSRATSAASGTLLDGTPVSGKWHVQPEMAAGGLWSTPSDLAQLAIEIEVSLQGKGNNVLYQRMTREMIDTHCERGVTKI